MRRRRAGGPGAADAWLKEQLDPLLASKAYKDDGLVLLTFDTAPDATKPVGALLISAAVKAGATDDGDYRPANLLRTLEDGFTLDPLGQGEGTSTPFRSQSLHGEATPS